MATNTIQSNLLTLTDTNGVSTIFEHLDEFSDSLAYQKTHIILFSITGFDSLFFSKKTLSKTKLTDLFPFPCLSMNCNWKNPNYTLSSRMITENQIKFIQNLNNNTDIEKICTKAEIQMIKQQKNWKSTLTNEFKTISNNSYQFNSICYNL